VGLFVYEYNIAVDLPPFTGGLVRLISLRNTFAILAFSLLFISRALAGPTSGITPHPSSTYYLHLQTADGQKLEAPVHSFKAISLAVLQTMIKEGKIKKEDAPENGSNGDMTYYLDSNLSPAFVVWAQKAQAQGANQGSGVTADFAWHDASGKTTYTFNMKGVRVVKFAPSEKNSKEWELVISADRTVSKPPIDFLKNKTSPTPVHP
jgi:hypothetical protein